MVLDYRSFFKQRGPRSAVGNLGTGSFGVSNLTPQQQATSVAGQAYPQGTPEDGVGGAGVKTWGEWQMAPASALPNGGWNYQQQAAPEAVPPPLVAGQDYLPGNSFVAPVMSAASAVGTLAGIQGRSEGFAGGQQTAQGFRVNVPSAYGKPGAYYYNGHSTTGDGGQWIQLPVQYNEAADTKRWEYNGTNQESTMRRAVRYAYDDVQQGRTADFNAALKARLIQFYNEAGGVGVGYSINAASPTGGTTPPATPPVTPPVAGAGGGAGAGAGGNGGNLTDDQLALMLEDPNAAFRQLMRQRGYSNLDSGGYASQFLENRYTPALGALAQMAGHVGEADGLATQDYGNIINQIAAAMGERGGAGLSGLTRQMGRQAYDNVGGEGGYLAGAGDEAGQAFTENVNYLNTFGGSRLMQRAEQNRMERTMNQYGDQVMATLGGDTTGPQTWYEFMRQRGYRPYR